MATTFDIQLPHYPRGFHLITRDIISQLPALPESGLLVIFIKHTSAGLTINENADPDVRHDFQTFFNKLVPDGAPYFIHTLEGPDDMSAVTPMIMPNMVRKVRNLLLQMFWTASRKVS